MAGRSLTCREERDIIKKLVLNIKTYRRLMLQLLLVFSAFALMVIISSYFASGIVEKHIANYGDEVITASAETIKTYLQGHEITLNDMVFVIEGLKAQGDGAAAMQVELVLWSDWLYANDARFKSVLFLYGIVDGMFINSSNWNHPEDYDPVNRVWYIGALKNNGAIFYSDPYLDAYSGEFVMTMSRQVFDPDGGTFGVIALDVFVSSIANYINNLQLMNSGYAALLDSNRRIIIHPVANVLGMKFEDVEGGSGYDEIAGILKRGEDISAYNYSSFHGANDVAFFKKLFNGWYIELSLSSKVYYKDVADMRTILSVTGSILALLVCAVLTVMFIAKLRSEEANKTKSSFLAKMSHEIRTPMNAVIGMTELLMHEPLSERQTGYVSDINTSAHSLLEIINDILDLSKIESGKFALEPVNYNFHVLIDNICSMFRYVAGNKGIEFRFESAGDVPEILYGDEVRLRQILTNICGNAVKFTEEGYVRLKLSVSGDTLMFEVKDTGMGIPKEEMSKLFNAFVQVRTERNRSVPGTGLGLAISKSFAEMMGGKIAIDSEYGQGTVVTVMIPKVTGNQSEIRDTDMEARELPLYAPAADVLLVDDNSFNLKVAYELLKLYGIEAHTVGSGRSAVELVKKTDYDIVFMDHMMPEMDGIEATGEIRKLGGKYKKLPIIALTANAVEGAREMFLINGFNGYISKPIDIQELSAVLRDWLPQEKIALRVLEEPVGAGAGQAGAEKAGAGQRAYCEQAAAAPPGSQSQAQTQTAGVTAQTAEVTMQTAEVTAQAPEVTAPDGSQSQAQTPGTAAPQASTEDGSLNERMSIIYNIEDINPEVGLSYFAGMESMYLDNLRVFSNMIAQESDKMASALEAGDMKSFAITVHAMKSSLATIGALELSATALKLEMASKSKDDDYCADRFPGFNEKLLSLQKALAALYPDDKPVPDREPGDPALLLDQVRTALSAIDDYDNDAGIEAIHSLLLWDFGSERNVLLQSAMDALQTYDYDSAGEVLTRITSLIPPL